MGGSGVARHRVGSWVADEIFTAPRCRVKQGFRVSYLWLPISVWMTSIGGHSVHLMTDRVLTGFDTAVISIDGVFALSGGLISEEMSRLYRAKP